MKKVAVSALLALLACPGRGEAAPPLRWGSDAEGGAPYEFADPHRPERLIGFEVELVEALGRELGRPTEFVQNQFDGLIPGLQRGNYDLAICGLEITACCALGFETRAFRLRGSRVRGSLLSMYLIIQAVNYRHAQRTLCQVAAAKPASSPASAQIGQVFNTALT